MAKMAKKSKKILIPKEQTDKLMLEAFCEYVVGANPDFAYSEAYLKKCIGDYIDFQEYLLKLLIFFRENILDVICQKDNGLIRKVRLDEMLEYEREGSQFEVGLLDSFGMKKKTSNHKIEFYYGEKRQFVEAVRIDFELDNLEAEKVREKVGNIICGVANK